MGHCYRQPQLKHVRRERRNDPGAEEPPGQDRHWQLVRAAHMITMLDP